MRIILLLCFLCTAITVQALDPTHFTVTRVTAPYFIVDSNTPTTLQRAYAGFEITNTSTTSYSGLVFSIPSIGTSVIGQNYAIVAPASHQVIVGTLSPGQSKVCYFYISYPASVTPVATFQTKLSDNTVNSKTAYFDIRNRSSISANAGGTATQNFTNQDLLGGIITDEITYAVGNAQTNDDADFQVSVSSSFDPTKMTLISTRVTASTVPGISAGTTDSLHFKTGNGGNGQTVTIRWTFRITGFNFTTYFKPCAGATSGSTNYKYMLNTDLGVDGSPVVISSAANPLTITKASNKTNYTLCETATFTLTINNPAPYGVTVDSILDQLPAGFTYNSLVATSGVTALNSTRCPAQGSSGAISFVGGVSTADNASYFIAAGQTIKVIYTATAPCAPATNLTTTAKGYIGSTEFDNDVNSVNVLTALPLQWVSFSVEKQGHSARLHWRTAQEENTRNFVIQHRASATPWTPITSVPASVNSLSAAYSYTHLSPAEGQNFYRIVQMDADGRSSYSPVQEINFTTPQELHYNNPVLYGMLKLSLKKGTILRLYNEKGRIVFQRQLSAGLHSLSITDLPNGVYILSTEETNLKLLKQ